MLRGWQVAVLLLPSFLINVVLIYRSLQPPVLPEPTLKPPVTPKDPRPPKDPRVVPNQIELPLGLICDPGDICVGDLDPETGVCDCYSNSQAEWNIRSWKAKTVAEYGSHTDNPFYFWGSYNCVEGRFDLPCRIRHVVYEITVHHRPGCPLVTRQGLGRDYPSDYFWDQCDPNNPQFQGYEETWVRYNITRPYNKIFLYHYFQTTNSDKLQQELWAWNTDTCDCYENGIPCCEIPNATASQCNAACYYVNESFPIWEATNVTVPLRDRYQLGVPSNDTYLLHSPIGYAFTPFITIQEVNSPIYMLTPLPPGVPPPFLASPFINERVFDYDTMAIMEDEGVFGDRHVIAASYFTTGYHYPHAPVGMESFISSPADFVVSLRLHPDTEFLCHLNFGLPDDTCVRNMPVSAQLNYLSHFDSTAAECWKIPPNVCLGNDGECLQCSWKHLVGINYGTMTDTFEAHRSMLGDNICCIPGNRTITNVYDNPGLCSPVWNVSDPDIPIATASARFMFEDPLLACNDSSTVTTTTTPEVIGLAMPAGAKRRSPGNL